MAENLTQCLVITPEREIFSGPAELVVIPLKDGELGIAAHRKEMVAQVACGELRIRTSTKTHRFYVEDGFAEVLQNRVRVVVRKVLRPEEIDAESLQATIDELISRKILSDKEFAERDALVSRLRLQLRVFRREG